MKLKIYFRIAACGGLLRLFCYISNIQQEGPFFNALCKKKNTTFQQMINFHRGSRIPGVLADHAGPLF